MKNTLILFLFIIIISPYTNASGHNEKSYRKFFDETALYFSERIPVGTKVAVIGTSLNTSNSYSDYFIREMTQSLIGIDSLILVNRNQYDLSLLSKEIIFQLSGNVEEKSALSLGKLLEVETVIFILFSYSGRHYDCNVQIRAISVENGQILGSKMKRMDIRVLSKLL